jgi:regulatory protein
VLANSRHLTTESELYDAATRILMRRAHSVHEMRLALERRCEDKSLVKNVLDRLKHEGLIDDARYAKQFARQRTEMRKQGKYRVARDLRARGVPDRHIEAALAESSDAAGERAAIRQRIERKLKMLRSPDPTKMIDDRKMASMYRSLLRAGFPADAIRRELKSLTREEFPEVEAEPE